MKFQKTEKLGIIGIQVKNKDNKMYLAKAPCDMIVKKGIPYILSVWNTRMIPCPMCKGDKDCRLCDGRGHALTFSYTLKEK